MLKKTIQYEDFNGNTQEKVCYFHLAKSELVELEASRPKGFQAYMQKVIDEENGRELIGAFKELILLAYGKRSADGSSFNKSEELRDEFLGSPAYDALFMELVTDAEKATAFINGIIPDNLEKEVAKLTKAQEMADRVRARRGETSTTAQEEAERVRELGKDEGAKNVFEEHAVRKLTVKEVQEMDGAELKQGLISGKFIMP